MKESCTMRSPGRSERASEQKRAAKAAGRWDGATLQWWRLLDVPGMAEEMMIQGTDKCTAKMPGHSQRRYRI